MSKILLPLKYLLFGMSGDLPQKTHWCLLQCFLRCLSPCPHLHLPLEPPLHHPALLSGPMLPWRRRATRDTSSPTATSSTNKIKTHMTNRKHLNKNKHHQNVIFFSFLFLLWGGTSYLMTRWPQYWSIHLPSAYYLLFLYFAAKLNVLLNIDSWTEQHISRRYANRRKKTNNR